MRKLENSELGRLSVEEFKSTQKLPVTVVLDNIRSLNNIGSVFRTSDAFLVKKIMLCGITAQPPHREIQKTALGATESVDWEYYENTQDAINILRNQNITIMAVEQAEESTMLETLKVPQQGIALIFGNEVKGVDQAIMDQTDGAIEIPQYGTKHSLNISVSTGIVLWEVFKQLIPYHQ